MSGPTLSLDIETYSETDIRKCGSFRYVEDPAFQVILLAVGVALLGTGAEGRARQE